MLAGFNDKRCFRNHINFALIAIAKCHEGLRARCKIHTYQLHRLWRFTDEMFSCLHTIRERLILERWLVLKRKKYLQRSRIFRQLVHRWKRRHPGTSDVSLIVRRSAMAFDGAFFSFSELSKNQNGQNHSEHAAQDLRIGRRWKLSDL